MFLLPKELSTLQRDFDNYSKLYFSVFHLKIKNIEM